MSLTLDQLLSLVGKLDDTPGDDTARVRFRRYLREHVSEIGQIRDYVEGCLRNSGAMYNRALQDLINHLGRMLGFDVTFGRYQGVQGEIGHDGLWTSPKAFHIVVEIKTTDVYTINTAKLLDYINALISAQKISEEANTLGLFVVGRADADFRQLRNAIIAERRTQRLRILSTDALLSLAELMQDYDVTHEDVLSILRPSEPQVDGIVSLITRLVGQQGPAAAALPAPPEMPEEEAQAVAEPLNSTVYWLTSVRTDERRTADKTIEELVGKHKVYAFGERTPGRKQIKPGDHICFYANGQGVLAHAVVKTKPEVGTHPSIYNPEQFPYLFQLKQAKLYLTDPVVIDESLRAELDAFRGRERDKSWAWFVQATHKLTAHDFGRLTR